MMNQAKRNPRQNHKLAEHLLSSLTTAVIVLDKNLRLTRLNSAAEDLLHVSAGSVIASPLTNLLLRAEDLEESLHQAIENTQPFTARNVKLQLPENTVEHVDLTVTNLETRKDCC